jgi:hypothetical protein
MSSGDFFCEEHSAWNCACAHLPGSITTSGGGAARKKGEPARYFTFQDVDGSLADESVTFPGPSASEER